MCPKLNRLQRYNLLNYIYKLSGSEIDRLVKRATKEIESAKLSSHERKIAQKVQEIYNIIPSEDDRKPVPDDVKMFVWQRDKGRCVKCGGQENLEYDHIIPLSKGGSNTARNIQILCEKCNREKSDNIG